MSLIYSLSGTILSIWQSLNDKSPIGINDLQPSQVKSLIGNDFDSIDSYNEDVLFSLALLRDISKCYDAKTPKEVNKELSRLLSSYSSQTPIQCLATGTLYMCNAMCLETTKEISDVTLDDVYAIIESNANKFSTPDKKPKRADVDISLRVLQHIVKIYCIDLGKVEKKLRILFGNCDFDAEKDDVESSCLNLILAICMATNRKPSEITKEQLLSELASMGMGADSQLCQVVMDSFKNMQEFKTKLDDIITGSNDIDEIMNRINKI